MGVNGQGIGKALPNFLILGSQKAGTTSLYRVLKRHPEVFMPETKEVNFFFYEDRYRRGLDYYRSYFRDVPPGVKMLGEASPGYICHPRCPDRIVQVLPDIRLIVTVRHPVERAYSQYWDNLRHLEADHRFEDALEYALKPDYEPGKLGYFSRGTYVQYLRRYVERYGRERLLVLVFEDLRKDPVAYYRRCFEFLGVDPDFRCPEMEGRYNWSTVWRNPAYRWFLEHPRYTRYLGKTARRLLCRGQSEPYEAVMTPEARRRLLQFYRPWNRQLEQFLGRDLECWDR